MSIFDHSATPLPIAQRSTKAARRRSVRLVYTNALLWAVGNGLVSTTLIIYLARQFGADGVAVSWIVAAPQLAGVLRIFAPDLVRVWGDRRRFCIAAYAASGAMLLALPVVASPFGLPRLDSNHRDILVAIVALWCVYHLLEYLGTVALWSWIGDLVPARVCGRFIGRREAWMTLARIAGMFTGGQVSDHWRSVHDSETAKLWIGYALAAAIGSLFLLVAAIPLVGLRAKTHRTLRRGQPSRTARSHLAAILDPRYRPLVVFGCWFSFCNGFAQAPQYLYPEKILALSLSALLAMQTAMRLGQAAIAPPLGRLADRRHAVSMMAVSQALVALGPLFFLAATPAAPYWIAGAWLVWIAYAGLNVGLPHLMLRLAAGEHTASYIAGYFALTGVVFAAGTLAGGALFERIAATTFAVPLTDIAIDRYTLFFSASFIARLAGVALLLRIREPHAIRQLEA